MTDRTTRATRSPLRSRKAARDVAGPDRRVEDELDEALNETFPASDPIAVDPELPDERRGARPKMKR